MVIAMTNDCVTVYRLDEKQYIELLRTPTKLAQLNENIVTIIPKEEYSPIRLHNMIGNYLSRINFYYYDDGNHMVRKSINDILDIKYYEDQNGIKWPSYEYSQAIQSRAIIEQHQAYLIELDNKLNKCPHINTLFNSTDLIDFKRCYNQTHETQILDEAIRGRFYEVPSFSRLILRKNKRKLTSNQLENNIFIIATPSGLTEDGKVKYLISEYKLTKKDCDEVNKIFRKYLKESNIKVDSLSETEKYKYFDRAVLEHVQNVRGGLEQLNGGISISFSGDSKTWNQYKMEFFSNHGYPLEKFSSNWLIFSKTIVDARLVHNGFIVPLTIENYQINVINKKPKPLVTEIEQIPQLDESEPDALVTEIIEDEEDDEYLLKNPDFMIIKE